MSPEFSRRTLFTTAAVSAVALAGNSGTLRRLTSLVDSPSPRVLPSGRMLVGSFCGYRNYPNTPPESKVDRRSRITALLGGTLPVERNYFPWDAPLQASVPSISTWSFPPNEVTAGLHDAEITATILANPAIRWTCNNHEPDQDDRHYTPAEYVTGARHFYKVVKAADPTVQVGTILMQWSVVFGGKNWRDWYPGDDYTDYLGWDIYFRPWQGPSYTPHRMFDPIVAINKSINKPMVIAELGIGTGSGEGSQEFTDGQKTALLKQSLALLGDPSLGIPVTALTYFYTNKVDGDWTLDSWPRARAVLAKAVAKSAPRITNPPLAHGQATSKLHTRLLG